MKLKKCLCGSNTSYKECCGVFHKDITKVQTAEQLMRSRYTAYVLADIDYLMLSHHSSTRPLMEKSEILAWTKAVKWLNLEILHSNKDHVEFKAHYNDGIFNKSIHENSLFVQENGHWVYLEAV